MVQDALLEESKSDRSYIMTWTKGIVFLGAPCFTDDAEWSQFGASIVGTRSTNKLSNVTKLAQLHRVNRDFRSWLEKRTSSKKEAWCFYESLPVYRMGIVSLRVS